MAGSKFCLIIKILSDFPFFSLSLSLTEHTILIETTHHSKEILLMPMEWIGYYADFSLETASFTQLRSWCSPPLQNRKIFSMTCIWTGQHVRGSWSRYKVTVNYDSPFHTEWSVTFIFKQLWLSWHSLCAAWPPISCPRNMQRPSLLKSVLHSHCASLLHEWNRPTPGQAFILGQPQRDLPSVQLSSCDYALRWGVTPRQW